MIVLITIFPKCGPSPCFMFLAIKRGPPSQLTRKKGCHHPHPPCYDQPLLDPRWHGKHVKGTKRLRRVGELASSGPLLAQGHHRLIRVVGNSEANQRRDDIFWWTQELSVNWTNAEGGHLVASRQRIPVCTSGRRQMTKRRGAQPRRVFNWRRAPGFTKKQNTQNFT